MRFYNSAEEEFMKLHTDKVSNRFKPLFDEKLVGVRQDEDGRLYAILAGSDPDKETYGEPVDVSPFANVQVGPDAVTVSLMAPFAGLVHATRPYADGEMDELI